jgi:hypothetical protein
LFADSAIPRPRKTTTKGKYHRRVLISTANLTISNAKNPSEWLKSKALSLRGSPKPPNRSTLGHSNADKLI